jgi:pimeloyl-ACP methyl ester carboxylesterase
MPQDTRETAPTQFVESGGIRFAYRRFGRRGGAPLLLMNYFAANLDKWDPKVTNGFAAERDVILFDYSGIGGSSGETPSTVAALTKSCVEFCRALDLTQSDVLGFSLGGMIAQQLAADHPEMVRRIILSGTGPRGGEVVLSSSCTRMRATPHFCSTPRTCWRMRGCFSLGEARRGIDCSSADEGHLFIGSLTVAKIRRANVGPNEQDFIDAFNTQTLSLTQSGFPLSSWRRN